MAAESEFVLRPSEMHRIINCPGSLGLQAQYPNVESDESKEGTAAHDAFAALFHGTPYATGDVAPNGVVLTDEMLDGAQLFYDTCISYGIAPKDWHVEEKLPCASIHKQCGGTPDVWGYNPERKVIYIFDFKFGHRYVDAFENWQCLSYLSGIVDKLGIDGFEEQRTYVLIAIVQPRAYRRSGPVDTWHFKLPDVRTYWNRLIAACNATISAAHCIAGPHCRDCRAAHSCVTLQRASADILSQMQSVQRFEMNEVQTGSELSRLKWALDVLETRVEGLTLSANEMIRSGKNVPGWMLEPGGSKEIWRPDMESKVVGVAKAMGIDIQKSPVPITPTQAKAKGFDGSLMGLTESKSSGMKLVPFKPNNIFNGVK